MNSYQCPENREEICALFGKAGKCELCDGSMYFEPKKIKPRPQMRTQKKSSRMGAKFEEENHQKNVAMFNKVSCFMTPNSGAGDKYKGDEWINGFCTVMQELKTNVKPKISRGSKTYTCKRDELEKLKREGKEANVEFAYLKFRFLESDSETYSIISDDIMDSVITTLIADREKVNKINEYIDYYEKREKYLKNKILMLESRNQELERILEELRPNANELLKERRGS